MKTIFFTMVALLCVVIFSGCSKEDGDGEYSLNGTVWIQNDTDFDEVYELKFQKTTFTLVYTWTDDDGVEESDRGEGTYVYNHPNLSMTVDGMTEKGVVDGNRIKIEDGEGGDFIKQ